VFEQTSPNFTPIETTSLTVGGAGSVFTLNQNARMEGAGTIKAETLNIHGTVSPDGDKFTVPEYNISNDNRFSYLPHAIGVDYRINELTFDGTANFYGGETLFSIDLGPDNTKNGVVGSDKIFADTVSYQNITSDDKLAIQLTNVSVGTFDILIGEDAWGEEGLATEDGGDTSKYFNPVLGPLGNPINNDAVALSREQHADIIFRHYEDDPSKPMAVAVKYTADQNQVIAWRGGAKSWDNQSNDWNVWYNPHNDNRQEPNLTSDLANYLALDFVLFDEEGAGTNGKTFDFTSAGAPNISGLLVTGGDWKLTSDPSTQLSMTAQWVQYQYSEVNDSWDVALDHSTSTPPVIEDAHGVSSSYQLGQLTVKEGGSLTIAMQMFIPGGTVLEGGKLTLDHQNAIDLISPGSPDAGRLTGSLIARGVTPDGANFNNVTPSTVTIDRDLQIRNRFVVGEIVNYQNATDDGQLNRTDGLYDGRLNFDIPTGTTLTVAGVNVLGMTDPIAENGGVINVVTAPRDGQSALSFSGGGNLVLLDNRSNYGGAVGSYFVDTVNASTQPVDNTDAIIDFTGLGTVTLTGHQARDDGGAIYVSTHTTHGGDAQLTLGDKITMGNNVSGNMASPTESHGGLGGAVYVYSRSGSTEVTMGNDLSFSNNAAGGVSVSQVLGIPASGGAILAATGNNLLTGSENNGKDVTVTLGCGTNFRGNQVNSQSQDPNVISWGGAIAAIAGDNAMVSIGSNAQYLSDSHKVTFNDNKVETNGHGGAIAVLANEGNATVLIEDASTLAYGTSLAIAFAPPSDLNGGANTAKGSGGAIYASSKQGETLVKVGTINEVGVETEIDSSTHERNRGAMIIDFVENDALQGSGGAIYATAENQGRATVEIGTNAYFGSNSAGTSGGAIYANDVTIHGNTFFEGNTAAMSGGAIYISPVSGGNGELKLIADTGIIAFNNNTADGQREAVNVENTKISFEGERGIFFSDPIVSRGGGNTIVQNMIGAPDTAFVQFGTNNNPLSFALNSSGIGSSSYGVDVQSGAFRVVNGSSVDAGQGGFNLATAGTLAGGGTIKAAAFDLSGVLSPDATAITRGSYTTTGNHTFTSAVSPIFGIGDLVLEVTDPAKKATFNGVQLSLDLGSGEPIEEGVNVGGALKDILPSDLIHIEGGVAQGANPNTINLTRWGLGTYRVLDATAPAGVTDLLFDEDNITVLGQQSPFGLNPPRQWTVSLFQDDQNVYLTTWQEANRAMYWRDLVEEDGLGTWSFSGARDWNPQANVVTYADTNVNFLMLDRAVFDTLGWEMSPTVDVAGDGVIVSAMDVTGGDYTFNGGTIYGGTSWVNDDGTLSPASGLLTVSGDDTKATFNLATRFDGGVALNGGTVVLNNDEALGAWNSDNTNAQNTQAGVVTVAAGESFGVTGNGQVLVVTGEDGNDRTLSNHFEVGSRMDPSPEGKLTFDIAPNTTLTLYNVGATNADDQGMTQYLPSGGAVNVVSESPDALVFAAGENSKLAVLNNVAETGGGIAIVQAGVDPSALKVDLFSTFGENQAVSGQGGAIAVLSESADADVYLGEKAYFVDNTAGAQGGALAITGENVNLSLHGNTYFTGNTSEDKGGAIFVAAGSQPDERATVTLDTSNGIIAFKDNKDLVNVGGGKTNSLHLGSDTTISLTGDHNIYFDDPITSDDGHTKDKVVVDLNNAIVQWVGNNTLNVSGVSGEPAVSVQSGTFRMSVKDDNTPVLNMPGGTFELAEGATLAGSGVYGATRHNLNGIISPDSGYLEVPYYNTTTHIFDDPDNTIPESDKIGTMTFQGDLHLGDDSIYRVDLSENGVSDRLLVTGNISVDPNAVVEVVYSENDFTHDPTGEWTIIDNVSTESIHRFQRDPKFGLSEGSLFLDLEIAYEENQSLTEFLNKVKLRIKRNNNGIGDFADTPNQIETADGLEDVNGSPIYNEVISQNPNVKNEDDLRELLDQLSGEIHASLRSALAKSDRAWSGLLNKHAHSYYEDNHEIYLAAVDNTSDEPIFVRALKEQGNLWASVDGKVLQMDATPDRNAAEAKLKGGGLSIGADRVFGDGNKVGIAARGGRSSFKIDDRRSEADIDSYEIGLYAAKEYEAYHFTYGATYGRHNVKTTRNVSMLQTPQKLTADYAINIGQAFGEAGYLFRGKDYMVEPYFGVTWTHIDSASFQEKGGNGALHSPGKIDNYTMVSIGARGQMLVGSAVLEGDLSWQRQLHQRNVGTRLAFDGANDTFTILGNPFVEHSLGVSVGATIPLWKNGTLKIAYDGVISNDTKIHGGFITLNHRF
jgi:predicted outer membrane repeat protein